MFGVHIRGEASRRLPGLNIYPLAEWRGGVGFVWLGRFFMWRVRWSPKTGRLSRYFGPRGDLFRGAPQ